MSMVPFTLPPQKDRVAELTRENEQLRADLEQSQEELRKERRKNSTIERGVGELRNALSPVYQGLAHIFGEIDEIGVGSPAQQSVSPQKSVIWESWKQKLGGLPAKAIDALLLHGEMSRTQLRIHVGCATGSVADLVYRLNQAGIINKNGGKISLKEL